MSTPITTNESTHHVVHGDDASSTTACMAANAARHLPRNRRRRLVVGRAATIDARAWDLRARERHPPWSSPISCWPQGPVVSHVDQARCDGCHGSSTHAPAGGPSSSIPSGEIECPAHVERVGWSPLTTASQLGYRGADVRRHGQRGAFGGAGIARRRESITGPNGRARCSHPCSMRPRSNLFPCGPSCAGSIGMMARPRCRSSPRTVGDDATATDLLAGIVGTDAREQSGIWSTASGVLAAYRSESALASTELPPLDVAEFCRGANTMYICSAGRRQEPVRSTRRRRHR